MATKKTLTPVLTRMSDSREFIKDNSDLNNAVTLAEKDFQSSEEVGVQAGLLANFKRTVMDNAEKIRISDASTTTENFGPYVPAILPVVVAWYPNFPLKDLISVQDMDQELAFIIVSELLAGTDKADTTKGGKVETPLGPRTIAGRYPTGEIFGEIVDDLVQDGSDVVGLVAYNPLSLLDDNKDMFVIQTTISGTTVTDGVIAAVNGDVATFASETAPTWSATLNTKTGILTLPGKTLANVTNVTIDYVWNIEFATRENIPTINESFSMEPMRAKPRALSFPISVFAEYTKKKQYGDDVRLNTANRVLNLMYQYQVRYILTRIYRGAKGAQQTITIPTTGTDLSIRVQQVLVQLNTVSQLVMNASGRIEGNTLVVGGNFKAWLESLPDIYYKQEDSGKDTGFQGPRKIGKIGRFAVFYDDKLAADEGWMSYKGSEWYDAPYYLGIFMPITPTDAVNLRTNIEQAFVSMEGHRYDKPTTVYKLKFA